MGNPGESHSRFLLLSRILTGVALHQLKSVEEIHWTSSEIGQNKLNFKLVFPISEEV